MSIIMITHDLGVVANMCDKIAVMYAGKIVEYGTVKIFFITQATNIQRGLFDSIPKLDRRRNRSLFPLREAL